MWACMRVPDAERGRVLVKRAEEQKAEAERRAKEIAQQRERLEAVPLPPYRGENRVRESYFPWFHLWRMCRCSTYFTPPMQDRYGPPNPHSVTSH